MTIDWTMFDDLLRVRDAVKMRQLGFTEHNERWGEMPFVTMTRAMYENYKKALMEGTLHVGVDHGGKDAASTMVVVKRESPDWPNQFIFSGYPTLYWTPIKDVLFAPTPPGVLIHRRNSGSIVVTVNLKRGGFTCFLRPISLDASGQSTETDAYNFGFAFRAPQDKPSNVGKDLAAHRCGRKAAGTSRTGFAGTVDARRSGLLINVQSVVIRALRCVGNEGALRDVRWWSDASMREAVKMLNEYREASVDPLFPLHDETAMAVVTMVPLADKS